MCSVQTLLGTLQRLRDPTLLPGSRWPSVKSWQTQWIASGEWGCTSIAAQGWPWDSQIAHKNSWQRQLLKIGHYFPKSSILDVWQGSEYASTEDYRVVNVTRTKNHWIKIFKFKEPRSMISQDWSCLNLPNS